MLTVGVGAAASAVLAACTPRVTAAATPSPTQSAEVESIARPPSVSSEGGRPLPQELVVIPDAYRSPAEAQGELVELIYDTYESMTYAERSERLSKRAIIYLPFGYDANAQYNVLYLMHGGWGNEASTLGTPGRPSPFKNVLDNAIATGDIDPLIIVCPTYNNTSPEDSADFSLALALNENYHHELLNDLLPAVESKYATYSPDVSPEGLMGSRDHRGFAGFSMGAVATWRTFQNGLDYFRYFLPMSCGTSLDMDVVLTGARGHEASDYFVWMITGTDDFAYRFDEARAELLRRSSAFGEADNERDGNFAFHVKGGYSHDGLAATEYTFNGLLWFWGT